MVPEGDDYRNYGAFFPEGTTEFYHFLLSQDASVEVAVEDDDFREVARHFDLYILGEFVLKDVVLPLFLGLLLKYLESRLPNTEKSAIKIGMTCQKSDGSAKHLTYERPIKEFESQVMPMLSEFLTETTSPSSPPQLPPSDEGQDQEEPEDKAA